MPPATELRLVSRWVGALPLVNHVIDRLALMELLERYVPPTDPREKLAPATALGVLLRNLVLAKDAIYAQGEWAARCEPALLGLAADQLDCIGDDRLGRALDHLYDASRASLLTEVVLRTVRSFTVNLDELHNDSTTVTFSGRYRHAAGRLVRGQQGLRITHGFNKDHRPDLKQLLWQLTVSADGAVPVHYRVWDGNTGDEQTHLDTWRTLTKITGRSDFLYVADCKLCDSDTLRGIDKAGGRFLTILPRTRSEDRWFRRWIQDHEPDWLELFRRPHPRHQDGPPSVWRGVESPLPSAEGYRIVWIWHSLKALDDADARQRCIEKAGAALTDLAGRLAGSRCRLRSREAVDAAVAAALGSRAPRWVNVHVDSVPTETFRKQGPGRPGPESQYVRQVKLRWQIKWDVNVEAVKEDARSDGMFPLITNDRLLTLAEVLAKYKYQPYIEKRHQQLKTVQHVAPVCLKNEARIEALLFLHFLALLIHALLERLLRQGMAAHGIQRLPLYPEARLCAAPTADRILALFADVQHHHLYENEVHRATFRPDLTDLQRQVLALLGLENDQLMGD